MLTARASCSPAISLRIHRPRSRAAACSACSPGGVGVALQACVVQVSAPPERGGPRQWAGRLASGVGGLFHARAISSGAVLVRGPVRSSACGRMPLSRSGNLPQGCVFALGVCLA